MSSFSASAGSSSRSAGSSLSFEQEEGGGGGGGGRGGGEREGEERGENGDGVGAIWKRGGNVEKIEDSGQKGETSEGILAVRGGRGSVNVDKKELGKLGRRSSENLNQNRFFEKFGKRRLSENWSEKRRPSENMGLGGEDGVRGPRRRSEMRVEIEVNRMRMVIDEMRRRERTKR